MNNSPTTFSKILTGINNTLNIANKAVPLYKDVKPVFKTIKSSYNTIKNNKNDLSKFIKMVKIKNTIKKDMNNNTLTESKNIVNSSNYKPSNNPSFFI